MQTSSSFARHFDAIPLPLYVIERNGSIVYRNHQTMSDIEKDPIESTNLMERFPNMDQMLLYRYLKHVFTLQPGEFEDVFLSSTQETVRISHIDPNFASVMFLKKELFSQLEQNHHQEPYSENMTFNELQQQFDSLMNENPDGIAYINRNMDVTIINQALKNMLGYSLDELKQPEKEVVTKEGLLTIQQQFEAALNGFQQSYEVNAITKNGDILHLQIKTIPIKINGAFRGAYKIIKDISDYKKVQIEAIEQAAQLRSLIDSIPEFVIFKDMNGRIVEMNEYAKSIFGVNKNEYRGKTCAELNCKNDDAKQLLLNISNTDQAAWEKQSKIEYEYELLQTNREKTTYEIIKSPTFTHDHKGNYLIAIGRDISERKKVEKELVRTQELIESIFTNNADAISVSNLNKEIIKVNPAFQRLYGYTNDDIITHLMEVYPEGNEEEASTINQAVLNGEGIVDLETVRKRKDGSLIDVSITYSPIKDQDGTITAMSAITRDIRDRKKTEDLLLRSEKLSAIGQLAAAVAHEVRNPLTAVKGFIQLYKDRINEEILQLMLSEMDRIESIIDEFLSLARPQAITYQKVDILSIIQNVVSLMEPEALLNQINIHTSFHTHSLLLYCEKNQITQVLMNVIKNGIESMPKGGPLSITTCQSDNDLIIKISDKGVGIPVERLERLGEPFFSNKDKGTGLGLVVCYKIIHEHKGTIHFDSSVGEGTVVTISIPL